MQQYLDLLKKVVTDGERRDDRTGVGTYSLFGAQLRFDLQEGFPLLTTKKMFLRGIVHELLWFLSGDTNVKYLQNNGVHIWDEWATAEQCARFGREEGDLGPVYGHQWRNYGARTIDTGVMAYKGGIIGEATHKLVVDIEGVDQIANVVEAIKKNPNSRRHIVTGWNPKEADRVTLPPCHTLFQFYVRAGKYLDCQLYQRSADLFLGVPFNIASYALLTMTVAQVTGYRPGHFVHTFGDVHVYSNHLKQVTEQLVRTPLPLPKMTIVPHDSVFDYKYEDFTLEGYECYPAIKAPIAV